MRVFIESCNHAERVAKDDLHRRPRTNNKVITRDFKAGAINDARGNETFEAGAPREQERSSLKRLSAASGSLCHLGGPNPDFRIIPKAFPKLPVRPHEEDCCKRSEARENMDELTRDVVHPHRRWKIERMVFRVRSVIFMERRDGSCSRARQESA